MTTLKYCWAGTAELVSFDNYVIKDWCLKRSILMSSYMRTKSFGILTTIR